MGSRSDRRRATRLPDHGVDIAKRDPEKRPGPVETYNAPQASLQLPILRNSLPPALPDPVPCTGQPNPPLRKSTPSPTRSEAPTHGNGHLLHEPPPQLGAGAELDRNPAASIERVFPLLISSSSISLERALPRPSHFPGIHQYLQLTRRSRHRRSVVAGFRGVSLAPMG